MIKLIRSEGLDNWVVRLENNEAHLQGKLDDAIDTLECLDVDAMEIDKALEQMTKLGHNVAHFGVFKTFLITSYVRAA